MVTFADSVESEAGGTKSTFNTGDVIMIRTTDANGDAIEKMSVTITYKPTSGDAPGAVLRSWNSIG